MQKIITFLLITLFALSFNSQSIEELEEMAKLFARSAEKASYNDYHRYIDSRKGESIIRFIKNNKNRNETVLIIAEEDIYGSCQERIDRYIQDIEENLIYSTVFYTVTRAVSPQEIKDLISNYYDQYSIEGAVLIGDVATAWFEIANDFNQYGYAVFPIDLYYMDMDGIWQDTNNNGIYNSHSGDRNPEIFIGRINTAPMIGIASEEEMLNNYLDRNHDYWQGNIIASNKTGLSYTDYDWIPWSDFFHDISNIWGSDNYEYYYYGDGTFSRTDYLNRVGQDIYGMIQFSCHSSWSAHYLENEPLIHTHQIYNIPPDALSYNLFNCSGCRWTSPTSSDFGYLGGVYVYNYGSSALFAIGSAKTGSMLGFSHYYIPLGYGETNGEAFKQWWINYIGPNPSFTEMCWFYGMTIVGDPMIRLVYDGPDASISSDDITIYPSDPYPGDTIQITARVYNIGTEDISSGNAEFYYNHSSKSNLIGTESIGIIPAGNYSDISISWHTSESLQEGLYTITVTLTDIIPDDINPNNNSASKTFLIGEEHFQTVYRFFNNARGGHLYTISEHERDTVMDLPDWNYEGPVFSVLRTENPDSFHAYRFFNTVTGIHLYTISDYERDSVLEIHEFNYEGPTFHVYGEQKPDTVPVYRFFNHVRGGHLYTISEHERDAVMNMPDWNYEGIAFYVYSIE